MKKGLLLVLAVLLVAGLFVSCNSDVSANAGASSKDHAYVTFDKASASKSVSPTVNPADAPSIDDLYWYYQAIKASGTVHEGEKTAWTRVNATTGLSGVIGPFSVGEWYFALVGMKTATDPAVTYSIDDYNNVTWINYSGTDARYIGISGTSGYKTKENVNIVGNQEQPIYIPMSLQQVNMTSDVTVKLDGLVLVGSSGISSGKSVWLDVLKGTGKLEDTIVVTAGTNGAVVPANTSREFTIDSAVEQVTLNFKLYDKTGENAPVVKEASVSFLATKGATVTLAGSLDAIEVYGSFDPDSYEAYVVSSTGKVTFKNTLTSAITDAQSGDTVGLLKDINYGSSSYTADTAPVKITKSLNLDGNSHTIKAVSTATAASRFVYITNLYNTSDTPASDTADSTHITVNISNLTLDLDGSNGYAICYEGNVSGTVENCTITHPSNGICVKGSHDGNYDYIRADKTILSVKDCTVTSLNKSSSGAIYNAPLDVELGATLIVDGGSYSGQYSATTMSSGGTIILKSGNLAKAINVNNNSGYGDKFIWIPGSGYVKHSVAQNTVLIEGGSYANFSETAVGGTGATLSITGGTFDADPSDYVAAGYEAKPNTPSEGKWTVSAN